MQHIPRPALALGLAGLIPFVWGAASLYIPAIADLGQQILGPAPRLNADGLVLTYGIVILSFMSGVLWGFATRATRGAWVFYTLSVLPALWAQFFVVHLMFTSLVLLGLGYIGLLGLDWLFTARGLAPAWWLRLRIILTLGVLACLVAAAVG